MRKNRSFNVKTDVKLSAPLNSACTAFLASREGFNGFVKKVELGQDYEKLKPVIETMMKKLFGSSQPLILKPECYDLENDRSLYMLFQVQPLSLESIILHHRDVNERLSPTLVYTLVYKIYDILNRIKNSGTDFYHTNLKPSNIFCAFNENDLECLVSECGLITKYPNKFYSRPLGGYSNVMNNKSANLSFSKDSYEGDLYSLGVIALEMITLAPIERIYNSMMQEKSLESLDLREAANNYGEPLIEFIKQLMRPRDNIK